MCRNRLETRLEKKFIIRRRIQLRTQIIAYFNRKGPIFQRKLLTWSSLDPGANHVRPQNFQKFASLGRAGPRVKPESYPKIVLQDLHSICYVIVLLAEFSSLFPVRIRVLTTPRYHAYLF